MHAAYSLALFDLNGPQIPLFYYVENKKKEKKKERKKVIADRRRELQPHLKLEVEFVTWVCITHYMFEEIFLKKIRSIPLDL